MKILVAYDGALVALPPLISLLKVLVSLGHKVKCLGVAVGENEKILSEIGVETALAPAARPVVSFRKNPLRRIRIELANMLCERDNRLMMRRTAAAFMDDDSAVIWTIGYSVLRTLGLQLASYGKRHINTAYELENILSRKYSGFDYLSCLKNATLVQCEINRAEIFAAVHKIVRVPYVIPNCPYDHPRRRDLPVTSEAHDRLVKLWRGRTVFLYQGAICSDREGLVQNLEKLCRAFPEAIVAIMPAATDGDYGNLLNYDNFCLLPHLPAPRHLMITSHATVGVAHYARQLSGSTAYSPLNTVYCAPNKIYEFSGFGIPVLGNDIPGLRYSIGISGAGECYSDNSGQSIVDCAKKILAEYAEYSRRSASFFERTDLVGSVCSVLSSVLHCGPGDCK